MNKHSSNPELPELDWIRRTLDGDLNAFEQIMRQHNQRLFRVARSILKDEHAARDAMQDGYIKAFQKLDRFVGPAGFASWLSRIIANEALQKLRAAKNELPFDEASLSNVVLLDQTSPETNASNDQLQALLTELVDSLPQRFRTVFVMRAIERISGVEVAEILGIPPATVKTRLHRAKQLLQQKISRQLEATQLSIFEFAGKRCDALVAAVITQLRIQLGSMSC